MFCPQVHNYQTLDRYVLLGILINWLIFILFLFFFFYPIYVHIALTYINVNFFLEEMKIM